MPQIVGGEEGRPNFNYDLNIWKHDDCVSEYLMTSSSGGQEARMVSRSSLVRWR